MAALEMKDWNREYLLQREISVQLTSCPNYFSSATSYIENVKIALPFLQNKLSY
jgi:hypothetical protein